MLMVEAEDKDLNWIENEQLNLTNGTTKTTEEETLDIELDFGNFGLIGHNDREERFEHAKVNHIPHAVTSFLSRVQINII